MRSSNLATGTTGFLRTGELGRRRARCSIHSAACAEDQTNDYRGCRRRKFQAGLSIRRVAKRKKEGFAADRMTLFGNPPESD
jgi:hypothetical protein